MKKLFAVLSGMLMLVPFLSIKKAEAINFPMPIEINSESAIVINLDSDMVIHEKNADIQQMPGPLVNIMTAIICLENCQDLSAQLTINESVYSGLYATEYIDDLRFADIYDGDILTVSDLLYAMMLTSSVEAAQTIANYICDGSISGFVDMMNEKAKEIGLNSTHFANPTGVYNINQYTTARDMAKLTQYALDIPMFETIATTAEYTPSIPNAASHSKMNEWVWKNSNLLMDPSRSEYFYNGAKGIKTGNLTASGRNVITIAGKEGYNYLVVLMKAPIKDSEGEEKFFHLEDTIKILDWAFYNFSYQVILSETVEIDEVKVTLADGNDYVLAKPKEEFSMLWYNEIDTSLIKRDGENIKFDKESFQAPIRKNQHLGEVTLTYSGETLATIELVAVSDVERSASKYNMYAIRMFRNSNWFNKAMYAALILCTIYIAVCLYSYMRYKQNSKPVMSRYALPTVKSNNKNKNTKDNDNK